MPGDHLRTPGSRLRVVAPERPGAEPWADDVREMAAKLATVPALVSRPPEPPAPAPAVSPCAASRGIHRPRAASRTWAVVALGVGLAGAAVLAGVLR